jgi:hypothetical protein
MPTTPSPRPLRFSDRLLDSLARRMSEHPLIKQTDEHHLNALAQKIAERLENKHTSELAPGEQNLTIDYPIKPKARWGKSWGLAENLALINVVRENDVRTQEILQSITAYKDFLRQIAVELPIGAKEPSWVNGWLPGLDGASLYALVASNKPAIYIEVGSGNSTKFVRRAIKDHELKTRIISIDPHPRDEIDAICDEVIRQPLEECDLSVFEQLSAGDICFIDNSHRCFQNSDVTVVFLEILSRLAPGVLIGFHDIFLPDDYPNAWANRFYSEQYLLAAFLLGGHAGTEILLPAWDASQRPEMAALIATIWEGEEFTTVERHGNAFWLRTQARPIAN